MCAKREEQGRIVMATKQQMDSTYNYMDEIFRLTFGETADITCALYNGDYSKTLEQAQKDKHDYILQSMRFRSGSRLLDVGCGWGPMLRAAKERGGHGIGITLSDNHAASCVRNGLEAYVRDWKEISVDTFGKFDCVVSLGAFEHFCSIEEHQAGRQEEIYNAFFTLCSQLLSNGERLFLQTATWGRNAPRYEDFSLTADRHSNEYIVAVLAKFYPGTWLAAGEEQLLKVAEPYFRPVEVLNGRKDYVETTHQWDMVWSVSFRKAGLALKLLPYFFRDKDFRYRVETIWHGYMGECFRREITDHRRIVFEKR